MSHFSGIQFQWNCIASRFQVTKAGKKVLVDLTEVFGNSPPNGVTDKVCVFGDTVEEGGGSSDVSWVFCYHYPRWGSWDRASSPPTSLISTMSCPIPAPHLVECHRHH